MAGYEDCLMMKVKGLTAFVGWAAVKALEEDIRHIACYSRGCRRREAW